MSKDIDTAVLRTAAEWLMRLQSGDASDADRRAFEAWREQSPLHAAAWQRAESVLSTFNQVPADLTRDTLQRVSKRGRRRVLQTLVTLATLPATTWLMQRKYPVSGWTADLRTSRGEIRSVELPDGSRLVLATASAVDVAFTAGKRQLTLRDGEILIATAHDRSPDTRPFLVETSQGSVRSLGTRFSVRQFEDRVRIAVFEDAVEIQPLGGAHVHLQAGQQIDFDRRTTHAIQPVPETAASWEHGMLVTSSMRLADVVAELARYRSGIVRCHPQVAELRVSGAFPLTNTDLSLALLEKVLPVRVGGLGGYWVTVEGR
jgi:transmembrane sensor